MYEPETELHSAVGASEVFIKAISNLLHSINPYIYIQLYRNLREVHSERNSDEYALYFVRNPGLDLRFCSLLTCEPVSARRRRLVIIIL